MSTWTYVNIKGQGHSMIFVQGHSDSTFSNFFSLETTGQIEGIFHVEPPWDWGTKGCSNGPGHKTNMAAMPIYMVKILKKNLLWNQKGWWLWKLVCSTGYSNTTKFVQMMTGLTLTYFMARSNLVPYAFVLEKVKTMDFSETIVSYDIKVGRCSQLNEYMKHYEYQRWRSFIDLGPDLSDSIFLNFFSSITTRPIESKFHVEPSWDGGTKVYSNGPGHMTKMAAMLIYCKNL